MPRVPVWMAPILRTHATRKWKPFRQELGRKKLHDSIVRKNGVYLARLCQNLPQEHERLHELVTAIEQARPRGPPYARKGNFEEYEKAVKTWARHLHIVLAKYPKIRRRFLSYLAKRYLEGAPRTQITFKRRHWENDLKVHQLLRQLNLKPRSFLEVGAAFESRSNIEPYLPDELAPVRESKQFFDRAGIKMEYWAADIIPIGKKEQQQFLREGIKAITWDYRERPLYQSRGQVKCFSVIRMANVSRHQTHNEFMKTIRVLLRSLEPNGILAIKNSGDGLTDEEFYQKQKRRGNWALVQIQPQ